MIALVGTSYVVAAIAFMVKRGISLSGVWMTQAALDRATTTTTTVTGTNYINTNEHDRQER